MSGAQVRLMLILLALAPVSAFASGSAAGHIHVGPPACVGSTCGDRITVTIDVGAQAVGHHGAIFIALLPVNGKGKPVAYRGAWATPHGWQVGVAPAAYARGTLPATWQRTLQVHPGICAIATGAGYHGPVGVFAGYAETAPAPSHARQAKAMLQTARRLHNPKLLARIKHALTPNRRAQSAAAAQSMLKHHTIWFIGSTRCE